MKFLKYILLPLQIIYAIIIFIRNHLYDLSIIKIFNSPVFIISVGNLNTGGTGKTPMIEYLAKIFEHKKIAILSRGYKRKTQGFLIAEEMHSSKDLGDELFQLYNKFPNIMMACDHNRVNGVKQIMKHNPKIDLILLDDAFQHRQLNRDVNILLTDYGDLFINDQLLPIGRLRESKKEYKRADIIIITKCPKNISLQEQKMIHTSMNIYNHQKLYFSYIKTHRYVCKASQSEVKLSTAKTHILLTGIANSKHILNQLKSIQINYMHFNFPDHYNFKDKDVEHIIKSKHNVAKNLLLTEKDYYRLSTKHKKTLQNHFNLICIEIEFDFIPAHTSHFNDELLNFKKYKTYSK